MDISSSARARQPAPRRGEARERILKEASALFQARGFADVSMQQIADAVGITKAALYYHFRNKEDLFTEVAREMMHRNFASIIERARIQGPLRERLADIVGHVLDLHEHEVSWTIADDMQRHLPPEAIAAIMVDKPVLDETVERLFARAIEAGEIRNVDPALVSALFLGMLTSVAHGAHDLWSRRERQPGDEDLLVDVFLHGIAAS